VLVRVVPSAMPETIRSSVRMFEMSSQVDLSGVAAVVGELVAVVLPDSTLYTSNRVSRELET